MGVREFSLPEHPGKQLAQDVSPEVLERLVCRAAFRPALRRRNPIIGASTTATADLLQLQGPRRMPASTGWQSRRESVWALPKAGGGRQPPLTAACAEKNPHLAALTEFSPPRMGRTRRRLKQ